MPAKENLSEIAVEVTKYLEYLEVEKGSSPLTVRNYKHYLKRFIDWLSASGIRMNLKDINPEIIRQFRVYLSRLPGYRGLGTMAGKHKGTMPLPSGHFCAGLQKTILK